MRRFGIVYGETEKFVYVQTNNLLSNNYCTSPRKISLRIIICQIKLFEKKKTLNSFFC